MFIDVELILRQAHDLQNLQLGTARAAELAVEVTALVDTAMRAARDAGFDDEPDRFLYLLHALRDPPLT